MHNVVYVCAQGVNKVCIKCAQKYETLGLLFSPADINLSNPQSVLTHLQVVPTFVYNLYTTFFGILTEATRDIYTLSTGLITSTTSLIKIKEIETRG